MHAFERGYEQLPILGYLFWYGLAGMRTDRTTLLTLLTQHSFPGYAPEAYPWALGIVWAVQLAGLLWLLSGRRLLEGGVNWRQGAL